MVLHFEEQSGSDLRALWPYYVSCHSSKSAYIGPINLCERTHLDLWLFDFSQILMTVMLFKSSFCIQYYSAGGMIPNSNVDNILSDFFI